MQKETTFRHSSMSTIFGLRAIIEAIKSGENIDKIFLQKGLKGDLFVDLEQLIKKERLNSSYVPVEKLNRLTKKNHQSVIAIVPGVRQISSMLQIMGRRPAWRLPVGRQGRQVTLIRQIFTDINCANHKNQRYQCSFL